MKPDTPLDSVVFELDETRTRCELWITAGDSTERLATGFVMPFLSHLPAALEQLESGADNIKLQAPPCPVVQGTPWFTKKTIERFVRFVSTPDVLERVNFLERERIKLAEATGILLSKSSQMSSVLELAADAADARQGEGGFQAQALGGHSMDSLEMETESSRRHLVSAMDARRLTLEKEKQKGFARAAAAGFSIDSLRELIAFAECFGATRLREACLEFSSLHNRLQESETSPEQKAGIAAAAASMKELLDSSPEPKEVGVVKNYGRRRVWGPPIPLQNGVRDSDDGLTHINDNTNKKLVRCKGDEQEEVDGAITGDGDQLPLKSKLSSSSPSSSSSSGDSDWEEGTESSCKNPIYDNVIGQLERLHLSRVDENAADEVNPAAAPVRSVEAAAVRRKGIIVIRNKNQVKKVEEGSDDGEEGSERDSVEGENDGGRLSVRAAISLFETKQKQSNDAKAAKKTEPDPKKQKQTSDDVSDAKKRKQQLNEKPAERTPREDEKMTSLCAGRLQPVTQMAGLKKDAGLEHQMPGLNSKKDAGAQKVKPDKASEAGIQSQEQALRETSSQSRSADEISKELLDKSYSCLLKINSVVQDALLSASALQQATQRAELKLNAAVEADNRELEVLPAVPVVSSLDDMFLERPGAAVRRSSIQQVKPIERQGAAVARRSSVQEIKPISKPAPEPEADKVLVASSDHQKGRFYDQYQERREAKYKRESSSMKAEREAKLKAMQEVLERRKTELLGRSSRLFEKNSTLSAEQMKALKHHASLKTNSLSSRTEMRSDRGSLQSEKPGATKKPSVPSRVSHKTDSPTSKSLTSSARKVSPGPPKAPLSAPKTGRLNSSPRSKLSSGAPTVSQRRMPNFMSQSVITESLHAQADVRKENTKPPRRSNLSSHQDSAVSKQISHPTRNLVDPSRSLVMPLETNRVTSSNSATGTTAATNRRSRAAVRKGGGRVSENEILAPLKIARDIAAEQNTFVPSTAPTKIPRAAPVRAPRVDVSEQQEAQDVASNEGTPAPGAGSKSSDECIKQIVSCSSTKERQQDSQDSSLDSSSTQEKEVINKEPEPVPEPVSYVKAEKANTVFESQEFDEDMQIDEAVEKCMSGRSFLEGISASPLINNFGLPKNDPRIESFKQELSSSLRTGPSSQSLPHLARSLSPPALSFRTADSSASVKESRGICREHHQPPVHKDQPKGLKRLLKFGRKHRASDSNLTEWSTINEDLSESSSKALKKSIPEESSSRTSGVRRSLESLPKLADVASELFSRNLFSSFRSKSNAAS